MRPLAPRSATTSATATTPHHTSTSGTLQMLRHIWTHEGMAGLYRGLRPTLLMAVPNTMLYYTTYEEVVQHVRDALPTHAQGYAPLLAGGSARLVASTATAPLEYWRTREAAAVTSSSSSSLSSSRPRANFSLRQFVGNQGGGLLRTLFRGLAPTLWRDVPFSAIYWMGIAQMQQVVWQQQQHDDDETAPVPPSHQVVMAQSFVNGLVAGTVAACCTTPLDVVKTRQQAATLPTRPGTTTLPTGTLPALRHVARTEGLSGLWRGNVARTTKVAPACAIMLASYEGGKRLLRADDDDVA